jgi:hypothetical protein
MDEVIQSIIDDLEKIPQDITSKINIRELSQALVKELGKKMSL